MKSQITLQAFMSLTNSKGEFKTWGDMKDGGYLGNLANSEVLGNILRAPVEVVGENIYYEYKTLPTGAEWNDTAAANKPSLNRVMFNLPEKRKMFSYELSLFGEKEAAQWSFYIGQEDSNIHKQIGNYNNTVALQAVYDYCLATGQFKVLSNLTNTNKTANDYFLETANISTLADSIMSTQTSVNLGLDPERLNIFVSPLVMKQITIGISGANVSQGAFDSIKKGTIANLFGYDWKKTIYLGQSLSILQGETADFSKCVGMVYNLDSLSFYQQTPKWTNYPNNRGNVIRSVGWKPFAAMLPSQEHTSYILLKSTPTKDEINAARAKLLAAQPNVYSKLVGGVANVITSQEYDTMKTNSTNWTKLQAPNVETR